MASRVLLSSEAFSVCRTVPLTAERVKVLSIVRKKKTVLQEHPNKYPKCTTLRSRGAATCSFSAPMQIRLAHTDVTNVPDFSNYRVSLSKDPTVRSADSEVSRKVYGYTMMFAGGILATTAAKYAVKTLIMPLGPTAKTLAEASTEVDLSTIAEGKNLVVKWRNKPLFIRHRTEEEVSRERAVPLASLRHPESDEDRVKESKWLICLGVCTHLGCVPQAHAGDFPGGYYCPCHGSHYDASGRIRKGPAPLNLEVPEYKFVDDNKVVVG